MRHHHHTPDQTFSPDPRAQRRGRRGEFRGRSEDRRGGFPGSDGGPGGGFEGRGPFRGPRGGRPDGFDPRHGDGGPEGRGFGGPGFDRGGFEGHGPEDRGFDGPGFGGPRGRGRGRGRRTRGDVRTAVLILLAEEPMHGYQLMQTITDRTSGRWAPSPGAIYPTLSQLEDEGLVDVTKDGGRKLATLTETGRAHVEENKDSWSDPFPSADDAAATPDIRQALHELAGAVREAGRSASPAQLAQAAEVLAEAKRGIYRVLAGDAAQGSAAPTAEAQQSPDGPASDSDA